MKWIPCSYRYCKSRQPGVLIPVIRFYGKNIPRSMLPPGHAMVSGIRLCHNCAQTAKVHDIVDNKRWEEICKHLEAAGAAPPDRESIQLLFKSTQEAPPCNAPTAKLN